MSKQAGFTVVELLMVVVLIGLVAAIGIPRLRDNMQKQNVRSARSAATTLVAKARAAAVQRGCATTLQVVSGRVWVESCRTTGATTTDTLGGIENLAARFNVTVTPSQPSLVFTPRGITQGGTMTIRFTSSSASDSILVNQVGKVVR